MNRIVATLSRLLDPVDRECACGDVEELRLSAPEAALNILGLAIRRQLSEWSHCGPWVALLGVAGLTGYFLSESLARVETEVSVQVRTYLHHGVAFEPGGVSVEQNITYAATAVAATLLCSWAAGFLLASFSRRTLWVTSLLFYCVVLDSWALRAAVGGNIIFRHQLWLAMLLALIPLGPGVIAFGFALVFGVHAARRGWLRPGVRWCLPPIGLALALLLVWMEGWFAAGFAHWSGQPYQPRLFVVRMLPWLACAWPIFAIPLLQRGRQTE